ncbi:MAG: Uma2 family endonuclease [Gemmataceae bacterium]|nr:Uma2 family endonuclease [Gemmataceae bacterium]
MTQLKYGPRTVDLPYRLYIQDVSEELFDDWVDEDTKAELIDGVMIVHSPASPRHDNLAGFLRALMRLFARARKLGLVLGPDALVRLKPKRKVGPDIFFLRQHRLPSPLPEKQFEGAPDLVVEILSPSNRDDDLEIKRAAYHEAGVTEIWFVDPDREEILVDRRGKKRYTSKTLTKGRLESTALEGFWIDVEWLWADELPDELNCLREIMG